MWELARLQDRVDREVLEEVTRHLVQLGLRRRGNDHAEVERISLELRLHGERLDLFDRVPGQERLLRGLQNVRILRAEITAGSAGGWRRRKAEQQHGGKARQMQYSAAHGTLLR